jgi:HEAT repeat protein
MSGDIKGIDFLLDALENGDLQARISAVQSLGQLHAVGAAPKMLDQLQDNLLHGPQAGLYRAIADAFQEFSGIKKDLANAFPLQSKLSCSVGGAATSLPEMMGMLGDENFLKLNQMLSDAESRAGEMSDKFNLPPEAAKAVADKTWQYGAMFADARDAKAEQVKLLLALLKSESPLTRAAAALSLPWYMDMQALDPLAQTMQDTNDLVRRASVWAHAALNPPLGYHPPEVGDV